jgi:hypothetical protein
MTVIRRYRRRATVTTVARRHAGSRGAVPSPSYGRRTSERFVHHANGRHAHRVHRRRTSKRCVHYGTSTTTGAGVFSLRSAVKLCGLQTKSSAPKRLPSCRRYFILFYSTYFTMSANRYEFKEQKLIAECDIQRPEEGSARKTDVAQCHHCQWNQTLHALRMKQRL